MNKKKKIKKTDLYQGKDSEIVFFIEITSVDKMSQQIHFYHLILCLNNDISDLILIYKTLG